MSFLGVNISGSRSFHGVGTHHPLLLTPCGIHHMYGRQAGGTHAIGMHSCYRLQTKLWEDNDVRGVCPWGGEGAVKGVCVMKWGSLKGGGSMKGRYHEGGDVKEPPPKGVPWRNLPSLPGQQAGSTHPTGMLSCNTCVCPIIGYVPCNLSEYVSQYAMNVVPDYKRKKNWGSKFEFVNRKIPRIPQDVRRRRLQGGGVVVVVITHGQTRAKEVRLKVLSHWVKANFFLRSLSLLNVNVKLDSLWTDLEAMSLSLSHCMGVFTLREPEIESCKWSMPPLSMMIQTELMWERDQDWYNAKV